MPSSNCTTLVIGDQRVKITAISQKIAKDISFLEARIAAITSQATPNTVVLKTYEDMLDSRLSVLDWLTSYQATDYRTTDYRTTDYRTTDYQTTAPDLSAGWPINNTQTAN